MVKLGARRAPSLTQADGCAVHAGYGPHLTRHNLGFFCSSRFQPVPAGSSRFQPVPAGFQPWLQLIFLNK